MGSCLVLAGLTACGHSSSNAGRSEGAGGAGCIQGVVVNGLTAERLTLPDDSAKGVFVLVRNSLVEAHPAVTGDAAKAKPALAGEYYLCGLPLDQSYPIFAWLDGFLSFEGTVQVHSTAASRSPNAREDVQRPTPTEIANIRVYPKNQQVQDLNFYVVHDGAALAGASVVLRATGPNFLDPSGLSFLAPTNIRQPSLTGTTDAAGKVTFPATELVLGGHYTYTVVPPNGGADQTAIAAASFVLGLRSSTDVTQPYEITVDLDHSVGPLVALSSSTDAEDPDPQGKVTVYFNREIELVPGTEDQIRGTLSGNVTAQLADDVPNNKQPEQVKVTLEANKLTLEPVYKTAPDVDTSKESGLQITYSGLVLRPKAAPETLSTVAISKTVRYYR